MKNVDRKFYPLAIIILVLYLVFSAVGFSSLGIRKNLENEMRLTLRDVASQNVVAIHNEIKLQYRLLQGLADELSKAAGEEKKVLEEMKTFVEPYQFKRMGYIYADGTAYTTDGHMQDLSDRVFFKKSMEGEIWISDMLTDQIGGHEESINVFSVPVYDEQRTAVKGVLFATYREDVFQKMMDIPFFEGQGYSCIVNSEGEVIAHSQNSPIKDVGNFLEHINHDAGRGCTDYEKMKSDLQAGLSGYGQCDKEGSSVIFFYLPVNSSVYETQWYLVSFAPQKVIDDRMRPVLGNVQLLTIVLTVIAVMGVAVYLGIHRKRREELESLAYEDTLTGGYNFAKFREMARKRSDLSGYVIAADLVEFKLINSSFGVQKGDETILALWRILRASVSDSELAARVNADRFVLFFAEKNKQEVEKRLQRIIEQIKEISEQLNIPCLFPIFGIYYAESLKEPDKCYGYAVQAKHLIKGRRDKHYAFCDEIDYQRLLENRHLEDCFNDALSSGEFEVWYQPKYSACEGKIIGAEALVRWRKSDGRMLSPGVFIPLFEKNGNIAVLDEYVFRKVCIQQKERLDAGKNPVPVSVNISRVSLYFDNIVERYENILKEIGLDVKYIQLEITESATMDNVDIGGLVERFHQVGFEMLLDDFGSGYSDLSSLNTMPFDTLKLDKSLIDYIGDDRGEKLLKYITKLGQSLGLHITAEGVETEKQAVFLKELKCDDIQGYFYSKPLPIDEYEALAEGK